MAASAICNEIGYNNNGDAITWANSNLYDSIQQSYDIVLDDVRCQSDNFAECTFATSHDCGHSEDLYLNCGIQGKWRCGVAFHKYECRCFFWMD